MTTAEQLAQLRKVAVRAGGGNWQAYKPHKGARGYEVKNGVEAVAQHCLKHDASFIASANPKTVLALLDEMERKDKQIAEMTDERTASMNELSRIIRAEMNATRAALQRIAELEAISSAAEKLVRCKGRYHSEQNYRALAALFGVTTPDLPPLESEVRTVTVKLPQPIRATALGRDFSALQYSETVKLLRAAGINLTVEG